MIQRGGFLAFNYSKVWNPNVSKLIILLFLVVELPSFQKDPNYSFLPNAYYNKYSFNFPDKEINFILGSPGWSGFQPGGSGIEPGCSGL